MLLVASGHSALQIGLLEKYSVQDESYRIQYSLAPIIVYGPKTRLIAKNTVTYREIISKLDIMGLDQQNYPLLTDWFSNNLNFEQDILKNLFRTICYIHGTNKKFEDILLKLKDIGIPIYQKWTFLLIIYLLLTFPSCL